MTDAYFPSGYKSTLSLNKTQRAIALLKRFFEDTLSGKLALRRVSAPLFVTGDSGLNDNLNGVERPVEFDIPSISKNAQIVHSLAKWKRLALFQYGFQAGTGLYTDMNAIRRDEIPDNIHSVYVDQWDWEKVILRENRTISYLKETVRDIVEAICTTQATMKTMFTELQTIPDICPNVSFITTQELEDLYPDLTPKQREDAYLKEHKTAFIMQIGGLLKSGQKHDGRAPDYDDWQLNGDILFWNPVLEMAYEVSSMGIRVDAESLKNQLAAAGHSDWSTLPFHQMLLNDELPLTMGGGIGQSRLCMLLLGKAHIGEVQSSIWSNETLSAAVAAGVELL